MRLAPRVAGWLAVGALFSACTPLLLDLDRSGKGGGADGGPGRDSGVPDTGGADGADTGAPPVLPAATPQWSIVPADAAPTFGSALAGTALWAFVGDPGADNGDGLLGAFRPPTGGRTTLTLDDAAWRLRGDDRDALGCAVSLDGPAEWIAVAACAADTRGEEAEDAGEVHLLPVAELRVGDVPLADTTRTVLVGEYDGGAMGSAVAFGDLDGDGFSDLLAGAPGEDDSAGRVRLEPGPFFPGVIAGRDAPWSMRGDTSGAGLGTFLAAEDLDGDGRDELITCGPGESLGGRRVGVCVIVAGQADWSLDDGPAAALEALRFAGDADHALPTPRAAFSCPGPARDCATAGGPRTWWVADPSADEGRGALWWAPLSAPWPARLGPADGAGEARGAGGLGAAILAVDGDRVLASAPRDGPGGALFLFDATATGAGPVRLADAPPGDLGLGLPLAAFSPVLIATGVARHPDATAGSPGVRIWSVNGLWGD
jgi:hypothetical protein